MKPTKATNRKDTTMTINDNLPVRRFEVGKTYKTVCGGTMKVLSRTEKTLVVESYFECGLLDSASTGRRKIKHAIVSYNGYHGWCECVTPAGRFCYTVFA